MNYYRLSDVEKKKLLKESELIIDKYKDRVPIIVRTRDLTIKLDKCKYCVPNNLTISQLLYVIRKRIDMNEKRSLFMLINERIPSSSKEVYELYREYVDEKTGMLFIDIARENTFGQK
jgi:hypothetical protein